MKVTLIHLVAEKSFTNLKFLAKFASLILKQNFFTIKHKEKIYFIFREQHFPLDV